MNDDVCHEQHEGMDDALDCAHRQTTLMLVDIVL